MEYSFKITLKNDKQIFIDTKNFISGRISFQKIDEFTGLFETKEEFLKYLEAKGYIESASQVKKCLVYYERTYKGYKKSYSSTVAYYYCKEYIDYYLANPKDFKSKFRREVEKESFIKRLYKVPSILEADLNNLTNLNNFTDREKRMVIEEFLDSMINKNSYKQIRDIVIVFYKEKIKSGKFVVPVSPKKDFEEKYYNGEQFSSNPDDFEPDFIPNSEEQKRFNEYMKSLDDSYGENKDTFNESYGPKKR